VTKRIDRVALTCLALTCAWHVAADDASRAPTAAQPCVATGKYRPICGLRSPEDLATLDGARLLVVQMRGMTNEGASSFAVLHTATATIRELQSGMAPASPSWGDGSCAAPDAAPAFHGFDRWTDGDGRVRILVVNHGTRSTIERFRLDAGVAGETLAWEGCVAAPPGIELNDVAALPGGGSRRR
jgi:hypothetical protein